MEKYTSGKVREIYEVDKDRLFILVTDRVSAFDIIMPDPIPDKGRILNNLSVFWFDHIGGMIKNHVIATDFGEYPAQFRSEEFRDRGMLVKKLKMLPIECIVRGYITGSGWKDYQETQAICGLPLPAGLRESEKLARPVFTPSTKAEIGDHDENISFERCGEILGEELAERVRRKSLEIYSKCADYALGRGIIIADTKFEFGMDENGELILADEVLTPDSSRFWPLEGYRIGQGQQSYDKQYLRDWLSENGYQKHAPDHLPQDVIDTTRQKYAEVYEKITGKMM